MIAEAFGGDARQKLLFTIRGGIQSIPVLWTFPCSYQKAKDIS